MKKTLITLALIAALSAPFAGAKSAKRGVCHNDYRSVQGLELLEPGVTWYYSWGVVPNLESDYAGYKDVEFVPMIWKSLTDTSEKNLREWCKNHPETKYILGYNEPNFKTQSALTPAEAAAGWPRLKALADELGLKIVAPALNYSPDAPYQDPLKWMDEFVALVGKDAFDFTAVHAYGGAGVTQKIATDFHDRYGKPVWLTEFCYWPGENGNQSDQSQINFMQSIVGWLESTPWIFRYAWFMATADSQGKKTNFHLLKENFDSSLDFTGYTLTRPGLYYVHLPGYNPDFTLESGKFYSTNNCLTYESLEWSEPEADTPGDAPLSITTFNPKGYVDYMFNAPETTEYVIGLNVSGFGEPERFDPVLSVYDIADDLSEVELLKDQTITLPNSDTETVNRYIHINLTQGTHRIRIKCTGMPNGMNLHKVMIGNSAGITLPEADSNATIEYFNLQGIRIDNPAPGSIVIRRHGSTTSKVLVK